MCTPWIITEREGRKGGKQEGKHIRRVHLGFWDFPWLTLYMWMEGHDQDACGGITVCILHLIHFYNYIYSSVFTIYMYLKLNCLSVIYSLPVVGSWPYNNKIQCPFY